MSTPKQRPILFNGPMIRAILENRKTQTRRACNPQPKNRPILAEAGLTYGADPAKDGAEWLDADCINPGVTMRSRYGQSGDTLLVKESAWMWCERVPNGQTKTGRQKWHYVPMRCAQVIYAADHPEKPQTEVVSEYRGYQWGWRLKIGRFLPKWAVRITLEITSVRVQRVQEISEEDAKAEGCQIHCSYFLKCNSGRCSESHYRKGYRILWDNINDKRGFGWDSNPWVWAITFQKL